eukprot:1233736-Rhodomonas_salina.2
MARAGTGKTTVAVERMVQAYEAHGESFNQVLLSPPSCLQRPTSNAPEHNPRHRLAASGVRTSLLSACVTP